MRALAIIAAVLVIAVGFVGSAFVVQNSLRTVTLSLNLGFAAWQYPPVPVMWLLGGSFAAGALVGGLFFVWRSWGLRAQVRNLERQLAMSEAGSF
ncbi:MAG: LapA family protein [Deltaproteobacteria bacterium]|nr:MAG: LapA family protein [Deltaproteobacteria bacterium]